MSFSATWLDLREPADMAARDPGLLARARSFARMRTGRTIVDLGAGTGSTLRAFADPSLSWRLVDHSPELLEEARRRHGAAVETTVLDLRNVDAIQLEHLSLVAASALFDLVSARWVDALVARLVAAKAGLYAALTYDGTMTWDPGLPGDPNVVTAFNRHQCGDKGFGPALGPGAGHVLELALRTHGYRVWTAPSPWKLGAAEERLQHELLGGIAAAAADAGYDDAATWLSARLSLLSSTSCRIGHVDMLALPIS